jgi:hypothetical protein
VLTPQSLSPIPGWRCGYKTPMLLPRWPGDNTPVQMKTGVMVGAWPKVSALSVWPLTTAEILLCIFPSWYNNLLERHIVQRTRDGALKLSVQCNALKVTIVSSFSFQFFFIVAKTWEKNSCDLYLKERTLEKQSLFYFLSAAGAAQGELTATVLHELPQPDSHRKTESQGHPLPKMPYIRQLISP